MPVDPAIRDHQAWLGYLQPEGLVVSPAALVDSQVILPRGTIKLQEKFLAFIHNVEHDGRGTIAAISDLEEFVTNFLDWPREQLVGLPNGEPIPDSLRVPLPEFGETLEPTLAFRKPSRDDSPGEWLLLVKNLPVGTDLDARHGRDERTWSASESQRFERLLRDTEVPIGVLCNGTHVRLIYKPIGESAGSLTFPLGAMSEVSGRPILAAFHLLLDRYRLLAAPKDTRLLALLQRSREYQSRVSTTLARQVLESLYELLRGFESANEHAKGDLLSEALERNPDEIYSGLLTVLLRLVFLLFAEDRGLFPNSSVYLRHYSVHGLFERLRTDNERYPDTMDHRYGAWAQLLALFNAVHDGCRHPQMKMPRRSGYLFDPARFPFLNGRSLAEPAVPLVGDGTIYRVLEKLIILDGERLSYRTLDVEEIGSVYQTIMGFELKIARGQTIALTGKRKHKSEVAAPIGVDLDALLAIEPANRAKWLREKAGHEITGNAATLLKSATTIDELLVALERRIARNATPYVINPGDLILQPTDERRRSGSHYTPRALTEPIVNKTLAPVLKQLGENPTPKQILELKVCDLAMGSGAFLVEVCRQLGEVLVKAWSVHGERPPIPADEDELLLARRIIAQRCLYGVDRNPMATDLSKLSLWLATLARDHPFTFLDHAFRSGDSLVGLSRKQVTRFHWDDNAHVDQFVFGQNELEKIIKQVSALRREILDAGDFVSPELKQQKLAAADEELKKVRRAGDLCVRAFFEADSARARNASREEALARFGEATLEANRGIFAPLMQLDAAIAAFRGEAPRADGVETPVTPFHWEIEFPEVFDRENGGFDVIVGNPPFGGKNIIIEANRNGYLDWLKTVHEESHGNADLVAHFFRRAFTLLRPDGTFGLIATKTIRQGDTRQTGLRWICVKGGGTIYAARRRHKWAGAAAVIVSIVWVVKGTLHAPFDLDGNSVRKITAFLFHDGGDENPAVLAANADKSFQGSIVLGMGFTFDDTDRKGVASPLAEMRRLVTKDPRNAERISPYLGGEEVNDSPTHVHHRYVINFADFPLRRETFARKSWLRADEKQREAWLRIGIVPLDYPEPVAADWPDLLDIVERKVKPERTNQKDALGKQRWWNFLRPRGELASAIRDLSRVVGLSRVGQQMAFAFLPGSAVFADSMVLFAFESDNAFCMLQSRCHEFWVRFFASSMKDDLRYTPTDCFETFPFPRGWEADGAVEAAGREYYEFRAALMVRINQGLTAIYNRFHDPAESDSDILRLRELHAAMDRAVLAAYGWPDIPTDCEFIPDYFEENESGEQVAKSIRYRWPDPVRDEVLARLLKLNAERAEQERLAGVAGAANEVKRKRTKLKQRKRASLPAAAGAPVQQEL
jgi:hypothetical protein